ncbi:MAG: TonB-dependent receptor domain-containing protein [Candidatus Aminicenantales bacterium]
MRKLAITTSTMMILIVFVVWALYAQPQSQATIKGMVFDQNGKPLPGVKVEVYNTPLQTRTSPEGLFSLEGVSPGKYKLVFTHPDYKTESLEITVPVQSAKPAKLLKISLDAKNPVLLTINEEITVTAKADSIIDVSLPSHRTILPNSVLTELGTANIAQAVEKVPGVTMIGKGGYSMAPAIRGLAGHRLLLLVDGVRITSERRIGASGSFVNLSDIDHLEVNRGPYSVFYGSGAVGGIINIITKSPAPYSPLRGRLQLGYNTVDKERAASLNLSGSSGKYGFLLMVDGKKADDYYSPSGKVEQSHYSDYDLMFKMNRQGTHSLFYLTLFTYRGVDIGKPSPSSKFKPRWYPQERKTLFSLGYTLKNKLLLDSLNASCYLLLPSLETKKENLSESLTLEKRNLAKIEGTNFGFKLRANKKLTSAHTLNVGFDYFGRRGVKDSNTEWRFDEQGHITKMTEETSLSEAGRDNLGFYIDDKIRVSDSLTFNAGGRFDYIKTSNFEDSARRLFRSDQSLTGYIGYIYQLTPQISFLFNTGRSFRFPTISELFYTGLTGRGTVFGNPELKPETSFNLDFGLRYLNQKFYASIYGFINSISNMIQKYKGQEEEEYFYRNIARGRITGLEGEFYWPLVKGCKLFVNFHHIKDREKATDTPLNYVPSSRLTLWTNFSPGKLWIEPRLTLSAAKKDPGPLEIEINGYVLLDAIVGYKINEGTTILAIGRNLLNRTYRLSADEKGVDAPGRSIVFKILYSF